MDLCWGLATLCSQYKVVETLITTVFISGEKASVSLTLGKKVTQEDTPIILKTYIYSFMFSFYECSQVTDIFLPKRKVTRMIGHGN